MQAEYITHSGDDLLITNAARVSFSKESEFDWIDDDMGGHPQLNERDTKLIHYLARHNHFTPFTHPQITLRYTVPIFVARQEFKHVIGFTRNEMSRRYVDDTPEFYVPAVWRHRPEGSVKQGSGDVHEKSTAWGEAYEEVMARLLTIYEEMIKDGVAPEQARMILPQSMLTSYYVTGSLAAFARFYNQRSDSHAQKEIQDLAEQVQAIIAPLFPVAWAALTE